MIFSSLEIKLQKWLFKDEGFTGETLGVYRILFVLFSIFIAGIPSYDWVANYPSYFYSPPLSLAFLFDEFPPLWIMKSIGISLVFLHIALLLGWQTRWVSISLTVLLIVANSFAYAFGKINHGRLLLDFIPLIMAFSGWGNYYSLDSNKPHVKQEFSIWPIKMVMLILGFGMFTAGVPKLLGGWLNLDTQAVQAHLFQNYYIYDRNEFLADFFIQLSSVIVWELFDYAAVLFELLFLPIIFHYRAFRVFLISAMLFHLLNSLMLNIGFIKNMAVYMLFMNFNNYPDLFKIMDKINSKPFYYIYIISYST